MGAGFGDRDLSAEEQLGRERTRGVLLARVSLKIADRHMCTCRGIEPLAISESKSGDTEGGCPFNEFFWVARAL